jgi:exopolysaccharide production protein ExoY
MAELAEYGFGREAASGVSHGSAAKGTTRRQVAPAWGNKRDLSRRIDAPEHAEQYILYRGKRSVDVLGSLLALLFVLPLLIIVAFLIMAFQPGPVFYTQERIGLGGRKFRIIKFRTMCVDADKVLGDLLARDAVARLEWSTRQKLTRDPRITWLGNFLRLSSIDELPQLINVLRGDMSLVGPRPIIEREASRYGHYLAYYGACRPGITGLWQVSGRNNTTYMRRVAADVTYSRSACLLLDMRILAWTIPVILTADGCS